MEQKRIYSVQLYGVSNPLPKLYSAPVIKETEKTYLCEPYTATSYRSRVPKDEQPALSAIEAWQQYIQKAKRVLQAMRYSMDQQTVALDVAYSELNGLRMALYADDAVKIGGTD